MDVKHCRSALGAVEKQDIHFTTLQELLATLSHEKANVDRAIPRQGTPGTAVGSAVQRQSKDSHA